MSDALFDIYDNNTNRLLEDRYEIVDILADNLLPPPNEYNNLFHDMLSGYNIHFKDNLSPLFYIARITLNYAASSVAASVLVFFLIIYGISTEIMDKVQCIVIFF